MAEENTVPDGFVFIKGATITRQICESDIFVEGKSVTINDLYVCDHKVTGEEFGTFLALERPWPNWMEAVAYCNCRSIAEGLTPCYYFIDRDDRETWYLDDDGKPCERFISKGGAPDAYNIKGEICDIDRIGGTEWETGLRCNFGANGYRLPTLAEREYIERGGNGLIENRSKYADINLDDPDTPTSLGLYGMRIDEWCCDLRFSSIGDDTPHNGPVPLYSSCFVGQGGKSSEKYNYLRVVRTANATSKITADDPPVPEGMVFVKGATIKGQAYESNVFVEGRTVKINDFYMCDHTVTQAEWNKCFRIEKGRLWGKVGYGCGNNFPRYNITWREAVLYCNRRSSKEGFTPCYTIEGDNVTCDFTANGYRLPTEAEWEYAARGGNGLTGKQYNYAGSDVLDNVAWTELNSVILLVSRCVKEVKGKAPNSLGLYDMSGNIWEWCWDYWSEREGYDHPIDPSTPDTGPADGQKHVIRGGVTSLEGDYGGDFVISSRDARSTISSDESDMSVGFRVVRTATETLSSDSDTSINDSSSDCDNNEESRSTNEVVNTAVVKTTPGDMVFVKGATVTGGIGESAVFVEGRTVKINDFYMCDHPITQAEYKKYCNYVKKKPSEDKGKGDNYPEYCTNWRAALKYCNRRSIAEGLTPCYSFNNSTNPADWLEFESYLVECDFTANGYRLPTEAEWEYAARGGNGLTGKQYKYAGSNILDEVCWMDEKPHEVKGKAPNSLGLYDMSNQIVWCWSGELCWDIFSYNSSFKCEGIPLLSHIDYGNIWSYGYYNGYIDASTPNTGSADGEGFVLRCCHSENYPWNSKYSVSCRAYETMESDKGFRVVRTATETLDTDSEANKSDNNAVEPVSEGLVLVKGAIIKEQVGDSEVFVKGKTVKINDFYMCDHPVTQFEYEKYRPQDSEGPYPREGKGVNYPMNYVSYKNAVAYCNKRSIAEGLTPCYSKDGSTNPDDWTSSSDPDCDFTVNGYRLPTVEEWEYAARGGNGLKGKQYKYAGSNIADEVAWVRNSKTLHMLHEVKGKAPNSLGLYDMSGNVFEWCLGIDWNDKDKDDVFKRGGSWDDIKSCASVNYQERYARKDRTTGFRVVRTVTETLGCYDEPIITDTDTIEDPPVAEGLVLVTGAIITEQVAKSTVFIDDRTVNINTFYICDHEVTQFEYEKYCKYEGDAPTEEKGKGVNHPAYNVSWYDALVYCNKRSLAENLTPCYKIGDSTNPDDWGKVPATEKDETWDAVECDFTANGYRLPTEAEWEYAARGGNSLLEQQYNFAGSDEFDRVAWPYKGSTHKVKGLRANSLDLYDMSGNIWEWCWDMHGTNDSLPADINAIVSFGRIIRGRGRIDYRSDIDPLPYVRADDCGFRVVRTETETLDKKTGRSKLLVVEPVPEGMILVTGATITGQVADSKVFIEGRTVPIADFYMCDHLVTQTEYKKHYKALKDSPPLDFTGGGNYPVYNVTWFDALLYCNKRSKAEKLTPCYTINGKTGRWGVIKPYDRIECKCDFTVNGYRLPTEAEWEYAARGGNALAGTQTKYAGSDTIDDVAWYVSNSEKRVHEVKGKSANSLGLYDMSGNIWEWCWDNWGICEEGIKKETQPTGIECYYSYHNEYPHVARGGSWCVSPPIIEVSFRNGFGRLCRYGLLGFRVVRTVQK